MLGKYRRALVSLPVLALAVATAGPASADIGNPGPRGGYVLIDSSSEPYGYFVPSGAASGGSGSTFSPLVTGIGAAFLPGACGSMLSAFSDGAVDGILRSPIAGTRLAGKIVGIAASPVSQGFWLVGSDGGVFSGGDAGFFGSMSGHRLDAPVVGVAPTPSGRGYWLAGADGGVYALGDAQFFGSLSGLGSTTRIVGIAATTDRQGYWLVTANGDVVAFGDARNWGGTTGITLRAPIVGMASTTDGNGYWLAGADGGVFAFGDATFNGSLGDNPPSVPVVGIAFQPPTPNGAC